MPGEFTSTEGFVLERALSGDKFLRLSIFSRELGRLTCLKRQSSKMPADALPDLFDHAALVLEHPSGGGRNHFVKEYRVIRRYSEIGSNYSALKHASVFARILDANLLHAEHFEPIHELCANALTAFAKGIRPDAVLCKALYLLAKDEGYAVKEQWWAGLREEEQKTVASILRNTPAGITVPPDKVETLIAGLQRWLGTHTDFII